MKNYEEIFVVHQTIGKRDLVHNAATTDFSAACMAAQLINDEIHNAYSVENKDGGQAWSVCIVDTPLKYSYIKALTVGQMAEHMTKGDIIQYVDADNDVCKVWIGVMRLFK